MQVEFIENGKLKKRRIIIGTSLEFEIAVFSFCALSYKKMGKWKVIFILNLIIKIYSKEFN
ncbi:unnamed protein product [Meloidogyne enterolobii]|uniref:Uncharacterized protein n=1 Tax=Meloidogyne enterolobii TaxID=390850 RepID=A0ACB0YEY9_MELEN